MSVSLCFFLWFSSLSFAFLSDLSTSLSLILFLLLRLARKGAGNDKAAAKQAATMAALWSKRRHVHMPFAWAARPVFTRSGQLDTTSPFSPLFRQEPERLLFSDMVALLLEYEKVVSKGQALAKMRPQVLPGEFQADVEPYAANHPTLDPALVPVSPYKSDHEVPPRREIQSLHPVGAGAHLSYTNFLYIYPETVSFASKKLAVSGSAQNLLCRAQLLETDTLGLSMQAAVDGRCVFGRTAGLRLTDHAQTWVLYHTKTPHYNEEMKFLLPASLSPRHHLLFTFYHVSVHSRKDAKKGRSSEGLAPVGYAFLPLLDASGRALVRGSVTLRVAAAGTGHGYPDGLALPPNYTLAGRDIGGGGMSIATIPKLRWLDGEKELFAFRVASVSTVRTADKHVMLFFDVCAQRSTSVRNTDDRLRTAIKGLWAIESLSTLQGFLPVIFNQLLAVLTQGEAGAGAGGHSQSSSLVARDVVEFLVHAATELHREKHGTRDNAAGRSSLLRSYAEHMFDGVAVAANGPEPVHAALLRALPAVLQSHNPDVVDGLVRHSWFFLKLITKSMAQTAAASRVVLRTDRFPQVGVCMCVGEGGDGVLANEVMKW